MFCPHCQSELKSCVEKGIITQEQWNSIYTHISNTTSKPTNPEATKSFNAVMVMYYLGTFLILSAFGWFMGSQWNSLGASGIFLTSTLYALLFGLIGRYLIHKEAYPIAGGLLITCCVAMTPLATYSLEAWLGLWPKNFPGNYSDYYIWINGSWIVIELATIAATLTALRKIKFAFLVMPASIALWFLSMDIAEIIQFHPLTSATRSWVSIISGAIFLLGGRTVERRSEGTDYAFWIYMSGLLAFWGGLTMLPSRNELGKAIYCFINMGLVAMSLYLNRKTFAVFGAMGIYGYLGHLAFTVFKDSALFPVALAFLGVIIILTTVLFQKNYTYLQKLICAT